MTTLKILIVELRWHPNWNNEVKGTHICSSKVARTFICHCACRTSQICTYIHIFITDLSLSRQKTILFLKPVHFLNFFNFMLRLYWPILLSQQTLCDLALRLVLAMFLVDTNINKDHTLLTESLWWIRFNKEFITNT